MPFINHSKNNDMKKLTLICVLVLLTAYLHAQNQEQIPAPADTTIKTAVDSSALYGYIPEMPIMVGGCPADQRKYLESLRDAQGKKVSYERKGSCCPYPSTSPRAMFGGGMLDIYEISYKDESNKKAKVSVYISFFDYEKRKAINGFTIK